MAAAPAARRDAGGHGDSALFDSIWADAMASGSGRQLFTAVAPRSKQELWHVGYAEDLLAELGPAEGPWQVLELGAGRGTTAMHLRHRGHSVVMVDLSLAGLLLARRNCDGAGLQPPAMVQGDATDCGIRSGSFDAVVSIGLLEHFDDPAPVLGTALRVLRPGGLLFQVIVPPARPERRLVALAIFAPWRLPRAVLSLWRHRGSGPATSGDAYRNDLGAGDYVRLTRDLGGQDIVCVPYNPYWGIHTGRAHRVEMLALRAHYALRRRVRGRRRIRASPATGLAQLLVARAPGGDGQGG